MRRRRLANPHFGLLGAATAAAALFVSAAPAGAAAGPLPLPPPPPGSGSGVGSTPNDARSRLDDTFGQAPLPPVVTVPPVVDDTLDELGSTGDDLIDDLPGGNPPVTLPPTSPGDPGDDPTPGTTPAGPDAGDGRDDTTVSPSSASAPRTLDRAGGVVGGEPATSAALDSAPAAATRASIPEDDLIDRVGDGFGRVARHLELPVLLLGVILVFLVLQERMTKNDPKLAHAPIAQRFVSFR